MSSFYVYNGVFKQSVYLIDRPKCRLGLCLAYGIGAVPAYTVAQRTLSRNHQSANRNINEYTAKHWMVHLIANAMPMVFALSAVGVAFTDYSLFQTLPLTWSALHIAGIDLIFWIRQFFL